MGFKEARLRAGKKVGDVAKYLGVTEAAVYQWETDVYMPRREKLVKLAELYGCTIDELLRKEADT